MNRTGIVITAVVAVLLAVIVALGLYDYVTDVADSEAQRAELLADGMREQGFEQVDGLLGGEMDDLRVAADAIADASDVRFLSDSIAGDFYDGRNTGTICIPNIKPSKGAGAILNGLRTVSTADYAALINPKGYYMREIDGRTAIAHVATKQYFGLAFAEGRTVVQYVEKSDFTGVPAVIMAAPVKSGDAVSAVLVCVFYEATLSENLLGPRGAVCLVDASGRRLAGDDDEALVSVLPTLDVLEGEGGRAETDGAYLFADVLGISSYVDGESWYAVRAIPQSVILDYSRVYGMRATRLVIFCAVLLLIFSTAVVTLTIVSYRQKAISDRKQTFLMSKFKKYVFEYNPRTDNLTLSDETRKLLGLSKRVYSASETMDEGLVPREDGQLLRALLDGVCAKGEASAELRFGDKILKADIYHIASKKDKIDTYTGVLEDVTPSVIKRKLLESKATTDGMTKLLNRETLVSEIENNIATDPVTRKALYIVDIDQFKQINDKFGHYIGDILLQKAAAALKPLSVDKKIKVGRLGGDEFCIYYYGGPSNSEIKELGRYICSRLSMITISDDVDYCIACSVGAARYPRNGMNFAELYRCADNALYAAKEVYGSSFVNYDEKVSEAVVTERSTQDKTTMPTVSDDNLSLLLTQGKEGEKNLRKILSDAVSNHEFLYYKQPQVNVKTGALAAEALTRWNNPSFGLMSPNRFIVLFERIKAIEELDMYMLECSFKDQALRRASRRTPLRVSVNLSLQTITQPYFIDKASALMRKYDVDPSFITIELTERGLFTSLRTIMKVIKRLHESGFCISIDDFGSGFTTLSILKDLDVDEIKIDKSFLSEDARSKRKADVIIKQIVVMAHELGIEVVAEGIETAEQAAFLAEAGVDLLQGYFIGKPVPDAEFEAAAARGEYIDRVRSVLGDFGEERS